MKVWKLTFLAMGLCTLLAVSVHPAGAQDYGPQNSAYLHALGDMRTMRAYLDKLSPNEQIGQEQRHAIAELDAAMDDIKQVGIDDRRALRDHPPIDPNIRPWDRFHRAREAGQLAADNLKNAGSNEFAGGLKRRALDHVAMANRIVDQIIRQFNP